jgi:hypothetical protein
MDKFTYKVSRNNSLREIECTTNSWQEAIDCWSLWSSRQHNPVIHVFGNGYDRLIPSYDGISSWTELLMDNKYNRVEKRIMKELIEQENNGMETVEVKKDIRFRDEIPSLMGKVFGGSEKKWENMKNAEKDAIINPKHYKMIPPEAYEKHPDGLEYMDLMEYILAHHNGVQGHLLGQIFKYACRLGRKDSIGQDAKKIEWYANRLVKVIDGVA